MSKLLAVIRGSKTELLPEDRPSLSKLHSYNGRKVVFADHWKTIPDEAMYLSDRFTRAERMKCRLASDPSRECTHYPVVQCMNILRFFKPKRWLDPCMGWGDRLLCALAYGNIDYVGTDTNLALHDKYAAMDKAFNDGTVSVKHYAQPFETFKLPRKKFDLVFTSPPFGTFETYDFMDVWSDVDAYLHKFLFRLLDKSNEALRKGGHLVLYIEDHPSGRYIDRMLKYVKDHIRTLQYEGVIYYEGMKPRPHYVWLKV